MVFEWLKPAPTLVLNDETGAWVLTETIFRVAADASGGSRVYLTPTDYVCSPLSPKQLRDRLFTPNKPEVLEV